MEVGAVRSDGEFHRATIIEVNRFISSNKIKSFTVEFYLDEEVAEVLPKNIRVAESAVKRAREKASKGGLESVVTEPTLYQDALITFISKDGKHISVIFESDKLVKEKVLYTDIQGHTVLSNNPNKKRKLCDVDVNDIEKPMKRSKIESIYKLHDNVIFYYGNLEVSGQIIKVHKNNSFDIKMVDGDIESHVNEADIIRFEKTIKQAANEKNGKVFSVNQQVFGPFQKSDFSYCGIIQKINEVDASLDIQFADGDKEKNIPFNRVFDAKTYLQG